MPAPTTTNPINHLLPRNDANGNATARDKKTLDPLFGPNIGAVTSGPAWTASVDKKIVTDDLTPDVVTSWIEKSQDVSSPPVGLCFAHRKVSRLNLQRRSKRSSISNGRRSNYLLYMPNSTRMIQNTLSRTDWSSSTTAMHPSAGSTCTSTCPSRIQTPHPHLRTTRTPNCSCSKASSTVDLGSI